MHGLYRVEIQARVGRGAPPIKKASNRHVLAVDGEALAAAFEEVVAEVHYRAHADVLHVLDVLRFEEAGELLEVRFVELRGSGGGIRVAGEVVGELVYEHRNLHAPRSEERRVGNECR